MCTLRCLTGTEGRHVLFNVTDAAEARLACGGVAGGALFERSSVYYWQQQRRPLAVKHEAICTKKVGFHVLTEVFRTLGIGFWQWKPHIIMMRLRALPAGDVLYYLDRDTPVSPARSLQPLFCLAQQVKGSFATFHSPCFRDRAWTQHSMVRALVATDAQLDSATSWAGIIGMRAEPAAFELLQRWNASTSLFANTDFVNYRDSCKQAHAKHEDAAFCDHRHDQAAISLLTKQAGVKSFPVPIAKHDPRDVWAWEAGYCEPGFKWPLDNVGLGKTDYTAIYGPEGSGLKSAALCCALAITGTLAGAAVDAPP
ncbi:hypothetical protein EMIHUDRAFT_207554 [Emiliania huxleyi CCMP1516]|uniref:Uncharacterized protein n=2 Tax=Emiliania huxleyi TaxID=2903 RepID=A0A0D3JDN2_EMIH1|nr:hypothetical protein EMIHUDRAFT_207554 [Emiliania huxleyi CCMP1516]EOD21617.1 hypothetical protein EMIHUDRAFT_207554 [Emiliania huxleyi CCMP1516]|eukprot:XP_005774046.1 hypothetical protein EMIHUDRAFT_207554 [Emiliania huxleyi CCMP1516]